MKIDSLRLFPACIFFQDEDGSVAIEYGIIALLVAVAIFGSIMLLGQNSMVQPYNMISETLDTAAQAPAR